MATAYNDNFADGSGWTISNLSVSGNAIRASAGGTSGTALRTWGGNTDPARIGFDVVRSGSDTAGRFTFCGISNAAGTDGGGIAYVHGTGLVACRLAGGAILNPVTLLAEASVVIGARYHLEAVYEPAGVAAGPYATINLYDGNGEFVTGYPLDGAPGAWMTMQKLAIVSNSTQATISRYAADPSWFGSADGSSRNLSNLATHARWPSGSVAGQRCGMLLPGQRTAAPLCALLFYGSGGFAPSYLVRSTAENWTRTLSHAEARSVRGLSRLAQCFAEAGIPVLAPGCYATANGSNDSWASPAAYAEVRSLMAYVRSQLGADTRFILAGYSMGALMAARVLAGGEEANIAAIGLFRGVSNLFEAWNNPTWRTALQNAWGINPASDEEAHALLDPYDPHLLVQSHPQRWRGVTIHLAHSTADGVVASAQHASALGSLLAAAGIGYSESTYEWGTHADPWPVAEMQRFAAMALEAAQYHADAAAVAAAAGRLLAGPALLGTAGTLPAAQVMLSSGGDLQPDDVRNDTASGQAAGGTLAVAAEGSIGQWLGSIALRLSEITEDAAGGYRIKQSAIQPVALTAAYDAAKGAASQASVDAMTARLAEQVSSGPVVVIPAPPDNTQATLWVRCYDKAGELAQGVEITVKAKAVTGTGSAYDATPVTLVSDANGLASGFFPRGANITYEASRGQSSKSVAFAGVDADSLEMPSVLGKP